MARQQNASKAAHTRKAAHKPTTTRKATRHTRTHAKTKQQTVRFRGVPITKHLQKWMDEMERLILEKERLFPNCVAHMTSVVWRKVRDMYLEQPTWKKGFEVLLAFAMTIFQRDSFRSNIGRFLDCCLRQVLFKSNEDLGIDSEYTRAGVMTLLEDLQR